MANEALFKKIQKLSDLDLALLTCFISQEHCIIDTLPAYLDELICELELVISRVFGLRCTIVECCKHTTTNEFDHACLYRENVTVKSNSPAQSRDDTFSIKASFNISPHPHASENHIGIYPLPNVIVAKNLDKSPQQVQLRALELIKTRQIYTTTETLCAPRPFLLIAVLAGSEGPRLNEHLNDSIFISHFYLPESQFSNLEASDEEASNPSVVKRYINRQPTGESVDLIVSTQEIEHLIGMSKVVYFSVEVKQYQMNIISFLRMHRAVAGGITAVATQHFDKLARCLASLHNLDYVSPSIVALAAKKIYVHRIKIVSPENERSMQWGSDLEAVRELLEGIGPEEVLDEVLGNSGVESPL